PTPTSTLSLHDALPIYFAKAFLYPLAAAPLVKLLGTRGLLVTNALGLSLAIVLAYGELRRQAPAGRAVAAALLLFLGTVAPLYLDRKSTRLNSSHLGIS